MHEGREPGLFALLQQLAGVSGVIKATQRLIQGMSRVLRLNQHFAARCSATGPTGNLSESCKQSFGGAKISAVQRIICADDTYEVDEWKVMTFRKHLRP